MRSQKIKCWKAIDILHGIKWVYSRKGCSRDLVSSSVKKEEAMFMYQKNPIHTHINVKKSWLFFFFFFSMSKKPTVLPEFLIFFLFFVLLDPCVAWRSCEMCVVSPSIRLSPHLLTAFFEIYTLDFSDFSMWVEICNPKNWRSPLI